MKYNDRCIRRQIARLELKQDARFIRREIAGLDL